MKHVPLSYIELSASRLQANISQFKKLIPHDTRIAAVIKANAYGHGQNEIAHIIEPFVDYFQLDDALELRHIRTISKKPTYIFGYVSKQELPEVIRNQGIFTLSDYERLRAINETAKKLHVNAHVHIKIDALLGRQGLLEREVAPFLTVIRTYHAIKVDGYYSHFANIEDTSDGSHAKKQIEVFERIRSVFTAYGYGAIDHHISATSGILAYESHQHHSTIVRLGIGMYGMWPSAGLEKQYRKNILLRPALRWITHIAQVKTVPAKYTIGYGLTYVTKKTTTVAVIPQGYGDGFDRGLSNKGHVLIHGLRCAVIGRIAMNMFVVDVSHVRNVKQYDEVVILGNQGSDRITAEEIAAHLDSINYEITTRISPLLPRVVIP